MTTDGDNPTQDPQADGAAPLPAAVNGGGRDEAGRFAKGNKAGRGNPANRKAQQLRSALLAAVSTKDLRAIVRQLVQQAKGGDTTAAKVLLDRLLGTPGPWDITIRLEKLEDLLGEASHVE